MVLKVDQTRREREKKKKHFMRQLNSSRMQLIIRKKHLSRLFLISVFVFSLFGLTSSPIGFDSTIKTIEIFFRSFTSASPFTLIIRTNGSSTSLPNPYLCQFKVDRYQPLFDSINRSLMTSFSASTFLLSAPNLLINQWKWGDLLNNSTSRANRISFARIGWKEE